MLNYLVNEMKYPASIISVEKELELNGQKKRYDVVVYKQTKPYLIVECKAPYIELDTQVVEQALRYNLVLKADFVMLTNGIGDVVFDSANTITQLPDYRL